MTQPIFKSIAKLSGKSSSLAPAGQVTGSQNNSATTQQSKLQTEQSKSEQQLSDANSQANLPKVLDKSELLALFTVPIADPFATGLPVTKLPANNKVSVHINNASDTNDTNDASEMSVATQRLSLYRAQHERTRLLYMASATARPTYLVQKLKSQFVEYQHYLLAEQLDKRGLIDTEVLERLWQQLHVVDDIIADIVHHMPAQQPAGWQLTVQEGHNPLRLPTVGKLKHNKPISDQASLNSYVLSHFGVSSFTYDRGYYIGHVVGYLFSCYYCAHLSISYGVTALGTQTIGDYDYASLETPYMVRLLQGLDGYCKKRIYQLAIICARLSVFATDKRIERMLITEVNDFDKKLQQQHLDMLLLQGMMPESNDSTPLF